MSICPSLTSTVVSDTVLSWSPAYENLPIVIDNGSYECRAGYASSSGKHKKPHMIFKNVIYKPRFKKDPILVGNDIENIEFVRGQLRTSFDRNLVTQMETQEFVFDHIFNTLGHSNRNRISSPIIMNEPLANPLINRGEMSELLFEAYDIPGVVYYVDALASWNHTVLPKLPPSQENECTAGLIFSFGYHTIHAIPMQISHQQSLATMRPVLNKSRRINVGGAHVDYLMQRLMQLKYPSHGGYMTLSLAEHLVKKCGKIATPYREVADLWRDSSYEEVNAYSYQLPYPKRADVLAENGAAKQLRIDKLKEAHKERIRNQFHNEKAELQRLENLHLLFVQGFNTETRPKSSFDLKILLRNGLASFQLPDRSALNEALSEKRACVERLQKKLDENSNNQSHDKKEKDFSSFSALKRDTFEVVTPLSAPPLKELTEMVMMDDMDEDALNEDDEDDEVAIKKRRIEAMKLGAARRREVTRIYQQQLKAKRLLAVKELESRRGYDYLAWITHVRNQRRYVHECVQRQQRNSATTANNASGKKLTPDLSTLSGTGATNGSSLAGSTSMTETNPLAERRARQNQKLKEMTAQLMSSSSDHGKKASSGTKLSSEGSETNLVGTEDTDSTLADEDSDGNRAPRPSQQLSQTPVDTIEEDDAAELLTQLDLLLTQYDPAHSKETYAAVSDEILDEYFKVHIASEQIKCPEVLFHPSLVGCDQTSLPELLDYLLLPQSTFLSHPSWRSEESGSATLHVLFTGGPSQLPGMDERILAEVTQRLSPHVKVISHSPENGSLDAWLGAREWTLSQTEKYGSVLSSPYCISRRIYEELGHDYIMENHMSNLRISSVTTQ